MTRTDKIKQILRKFGAGSYWYGEDGDYDMQLPEVESEPFFAEAMRDILSLCDEGGDVQMKMK